MPYRGQGIERYRGRMRSAPGAILEVLVFGGARLEALGDHRLDEIVAKSAGTDQRIGPRANNVGEQPRADARGRSVEDVARLLDR